MRKLILLFLLVFFIQSNPIKAQSGEHLQPVGSVFGIEFNYFYQIRKILLNGISDYQVIQFMVLPSYGYESVLAIELDTTNIKKIKYYLVYHKCQESIWNNIMLHNKNEEIKVEKYRIEIEEESVDKIKKLFNVALSQTKFEENLCMDCVQYIFSTTFGLRTGRIRFPGINYKETKISNLVEIGNDLIQLAITEKTIIEFDKNFIDKIEALIEDFN